MTKSKIIRFTKLSSGLIAHYEKRRNLLLVDRELYDTLPERQKALVLRTENPFMLAEEVRKQLSS